jgi:hypothetical protein
MKEIKYKPASSAGAGCAGSCKIGSTPPEPPLKRHVLFYEVMQDLQDLGSSYGPTQRGEPYAPVRDVYHLGGPRCALAVREVSSLPFGAQDSGVGIWILPCRRAVHRRSSLLHPEGNLEAWLVPAGFSL